MKRSGFTMIELIFMIVIVGIIGSVVIVKNNGIKEKQIIAKQAADLAQLIKDLGNYYIAHGTFRGASSSDISNVKLIDPYENSAQGSYFYMQIGENPSSTCVGAVIRDLDKGVISVGNTSNIELWSYKDRYEYKICHAVQVATKSLHKYYYFGDSKVTY